MLYPFRDNETGEMVELHYAMADPTLPSIGTVIVHEGRTITRVCSDFVPARKGRGFKPFKSMQLPEGLPGVKYGKDGFAQIESEKQVKNMCAKSKDMPKEKNGMGGTGAWSYDP
jgi:hypothetical protein